MTFQIEPWSEFWRDGQEIFPIHFEELAVHKESVPLGMDDALYRQLESMGRLLIVTARKQGRLIGYYMAIIVPNHPHNKDAGPQSTTDFFYMLRAHRKGGAGAKLLMTAEAALKARGVKKASISVKLHQDHSKVLKALGWTPTDLVLQKLL